MPKDKMTLLFTPLAINSGGKMIVLDTGNGRGCVCRQQGRERSVR